MNEIILSIIYTSAALLEFSIAVYLIIADRRSPGNRFMAIFFLTVAANSFSFGGLTGVFSIEQARPLIVMLLASIYSIGPAIYLATVAALRPRWLRHWWLYTPFYILLVAPTVLVILDATGLSRFLSPSPLLFVFPDAATYAGGPVVGRDLTVGLFGPAVRFVQSTIPGLAMICPMLVVALKDWKTNPANSRTAWLFFLATAGATASLFLLSEQFSTTESGVIASLFYVVAFFLSALFRSGIPWSRSAVRQSLGNWPIFAKLVLVVTAVLVPAVVLISLVSSSIFRSNVTEQIGTSFNALARLQARSIADSLDAEIGNLERLSQSPVLRASISVQLRQTSGLNDQAMRTWLNERELDWVLNDTSMMVVLPQGQLTSVSVLREFQRTFPAYSYLQVTDANGALVAATETPVHFDYSNAGWWRAAYARGDGSEFLSVPLQNLAVSNRYLQVALPIYGNDGSTVLGVLLANYDLTVVLANLASNRIGEAGRSDLFTPGGILVPINTGQAAVQNRNIGLNWDDLLNGQADWRIVPYNNISSILSWATVRDEAPTGPSTGLEWRVTVHQPITEALRSVTTAQQASTFTTLITTVLGFAFAWLLASFITQPLFTLTSVAEQVLEGNLDVRADITASDEIGILASTFNTMTSQVRNLVTNLESQVASRTADLADQTRKLQAATQVGQGVSSILEVNELIRTTVAAIQERFDLYYVGLFLADGPREWAILQQGTGEAGRQMLARGHRIRIGEGMIGWSIQNAQARVAGEASADRVRLAIPELPETRSEAAIPLRARGQTIGALSVQSERPNEFDGATLNILQGLADQVGIAIDNANLLQENKSALAESRQALDTVRRTYQQVTAEAWTETTQRTQWGVVATPEGVQWKPVDGGNGNGHGNGKNGGSPGGGKELAVPIRVREHTVGTIRLRRPEGSGDWNPAESQYIESYVNQLGLALDSARLFQDIQTRSVQLQASAEIGRVTTSILRLEELLPAAVDLIGSRFNLYYAGIFMLDDEKKWAVLKAGTGLAGEQQVSTGHRLEIGGQSMIGQCIAEGAARIAMDVGAEAVRFENPVLPDTRTEMALPLQTGGETIGALTIQSTKQAAFTGDDITVFQTLANQLATAIQNARLFEQTQEATLTAQEQRRIADALLKSSVRFAESLDQTEVFKIIIAEIDEQIRPDQINLLVLDELTDRFILAARFAPDEAEDGYQVGDLIPIEDRPDLMRIFERGEHIYNPERRADGFIHEQYRLPLLLGSQAIGVAEIFHTARDAHIRVEDRAVIDGIIQQAAVALQSAQSFRQTQDALSRTEALYQIGQAAITADNLTQLLKSTSSILYQALNSDRVVIRRIDPAAGRILEAIGDGPGVQHSPLDLPFDQLMEGLHGWVLSERKPALSPKNTPDPRDTDNTRQLRLKANCGAILVVPILDREVVIGMITVINTPEQPDFNDEDEELVLAVANQISVAIQNRVLFSETQKTAQNERLLNDIGSQLIQSLDFETILRTAVEEIGHLPNIKNVTLTVGKTDQPNGEQAGERPQDPE